MRTAHATRLNGSNGPEKHRPGFHSTPNALAGVGYAFWLGRSFNLTVNADLDLQTYGNQSSGADVTSARGGSLWLGFDWY